MAKKINILLSGSPFSWNYGAMAILIAAIENLKKTIPEAVFYKGSVTKELDFKRYRPFFKQKELKIFGFNKGRMPFPLSLPFLLLGSIPYLQKADLILEVPGDISTNTNLFSQLVRFLFYRLFNKNFVIYSCSLGPFKGKIAELIARYLYNHVSLLIVREEPSRDYLKKIGVKKIFLTADHAFLLTGKPNKSLEQLAQSSKPFVGVSVKYLFGQQFAGYQELIMAIIEHLNQKMKFNVILIPHVDKDKILSKKIYGLVKNSQVHLLKGNYSPAELKALIGKGEFFVGSRLHASIGALSLGIPAMVLIPRASHRGMGLMKLFKMDGLVLDPFEKPKKVNFLLEKSYQKRKALQKKIKKYLPQVKKLAAKNSLLIKEFLERGKKRSLLGKTRGCYLAFAKDRQVRYAASSGGSVTALLLFLLKKRLIDGALVTQMDEKNLLKAKVKLAFTPKEIIQAMGSKYQPVALLSGLKEISKTKNKKFAVVGLPCHIQSLRRLEKENPALKKKIFLCLGLFCGSTVSFTGTNFLLKYLGFNLKEVKGISYRGHGWPGKLVVKTENKSHSFSYSELANFFNLGLFVPPACFQCADFSNELADLSFGDAWLPEIMKKDKLGTNIIIARTKKGEGILKRANKVISVKRINEKKIIKAFWWRLYSKKGKLSFPYKLIFSFYRFNSFFTDKFPGLALRLPRPFWKNYLKLYNSFYSVFWRLKKR